MLVKSWLSMALVAPAATPAPTTYAAPAAQDETVSAPAAETTEVAEEAAPVASAPAAEETVTTAETSAPAATVSGSEAEAKEWIAQKESGGSYTATNGQYIGRYQLTDSYLNGDYSAENLRTCSRCLRCRTLRFMVSCEKLLA